MVETRYQQTPEGDAAPKMSTDRARQGQNIKGMIWVLVGGIALVVIAYTIMIALSAEPVTPDNRQVEDIGVTTPGPLSLPEGAPAETPQSPS
jgi:hypothetical protein